MKALSFSSCSAAVAALSLAAIIGLVGCGGEPQATPQQKEAVAEIRKLGGEVKGPEDTAVAVRLVWTGPTVTNDELVHMKDLTELRYVSLSDTAVTDAGLEHLNGLTGLHFLDLSGTQITDAALVHLQDMSELQYLWLNDTQVTDSGVNELKLELVKCVIQQ